jgi:microsomal epoxide hydrolase
MIAGLATSDERDTSSAVAASLSSNSRLPAYLSAGLKPKVNAMKLLAWLLILCSSAAAGAEVRDATITLGDGTRIHLLEAGQPSAEPAIVFIPGWTLPAFLWKEQMRRFSSDRLVIAIDPRSQGDSTKTETGNTPEQRARDLREILAKRRITSAVLVGWSQGANDVAAYVMQFGTSSIARLVFVDSPVAAGPAEIDVNKEWSQGFLSRLHIYVDSPKEYSARMVRGMFKKPPPQLDIDAVIAHAQKTPSTIGLTMLVMDIFGVDRRPALATIDRPTLVIGSAESSLAEAQKRMAEAIAGAELVMLKGVGHAVFIDEPELFAQSLERLLKRP